MDGLHVLQLGLSIGASAAAVIGAVWGLWKFGLHLWNSTAGRRRAQAQILDQLACTMSRAFVENLLGEPRFIVGSPDGPDERFYRLRGAWIGIQFEGDAVDLLSITITDSRLWYRTGGMTLGVVDLRLGRDNFAESNDRFDHEQTWMGNKQAGYYRHYHFGGAGGNHQHFWLSYNAVGAGTLAGINGPYSSDVDTGGTPPDPAKITANTLTILSPYGRLGDNLRRRELFGPHIETVQLAWSERKQIQRQMAARVRLPRLPGP